MEIILTFSIIVIALLAFAFEWLSADLTALSVAVILILFKLAHGVTKKLECLLYDGHSTLTPEIKRKLIQIQSH